MAQGRPATASGTSQTYGPGNAVDGDANSYWESTNNAFPQWIQVDLGCSRSLSKAVLKLPPATAWAARTQTLTVQGSTDGTTFTTLVNSAGYTFDPATGNTATINLPATPTRYLRLNVTGNTGWPAAQLSEFQVFGA
nr:discoidin domain-containing protein [Kitasatospora cineracea]